MPESAASRRRDSPLLVECVVYLAFAMPLGMFGAGWPDSRARFGQDAAALGLLAAAYGIGRLSTSMSAMAVLTRFHARSATVAFCIVLALADVGAAVTRSFGVLVAAMGVIGLMSGCLDSLGARYQTVVRNMRSAGLMFGAYGVGATIGPAVVALTSWSVGFTSAAVIAALGAVLAAGRSVRWPVEMARATTRTATRAPVPLVPLLVSFVVIAAYCGTEAVVGNWSATYLEEGRGVAAGAAGLAVSGFWAGITLGRLAMVRMPASPARVMGGCAGALVVVVAVVWLAPPAVAAVSFALLGLVLAAMFPTLMSTTADRVGVEAAGRVSGLQLVVANIAAVGLSALVGVLVARWGAVMPMVVVAVLVVVGPVALVATSTGRRRAASSAGRPGEQTGAPGVVAE